MGSGNRIILQENVSLYNSVTELYPHAIADAWVSWLSVCARDAVGLEFPGIDNLQQAQLFFSI